MPRSRALPPNLSPRSILAWTALGLTGFLAQPALAGYDFDDEGNLLVVDHGNHRGVVLTPDGAFVRAFGSKLYVRPAMRPDAGEGGR